MILCPHCGSDEFSKLSSFYRRSLPALESDASGSRYNPLAGKANEVLTDSLAPPRKASYMFIFLACQAFIWIAVIIGVSRWYLTIWASGWMIATVVLWVGAYRHNTFQWPTKMRAWNQTYICLQCGNRFVSDTDGR